jgi:hypothetical protein
MIVSVKGFIPSLSLGAMPIPQKITKTLKYLKKLRFVSAVRQGAAS